MKRSLLVIASAFALTGCASMQSLDRFGSVDTYAKCATADVITTSVGLGVNGMHEINPLTRALAIKAFGRVLGTVAPVVGLSIAGYYLLKAIDKPAVTATVAGATCFSAARNLWLIR